MSQLSPEHYLSLYNDFRKLKVLDDIICHRAADNPPVPILGYPRNVHSVNDYELFTGERLDHFIDAAVKHFIARGFEPNGRKPIALPAPSNVDFIVSFFALSRLGYTVFPLSLRITAAAILSLLQKTDCNTIIHGHLPRVQSTLQTVNQDCSIIAVGIPSRNDYARPLSHEPYYSRQYDREEENGRIALIIHSSGSTGLPKPIFLSHKALLTHPTQGSGLHNFNALPWYHLYGISTSLQAMWMRKTAYLYNTSLPLTADNLIAVMEKVQPDAVHVVPYALGLLAEKPRGVEALKRCKIVTAAGTRTPDELGDRLVSEGVILGVVVGTTEAGLAGDTMRRVKGDDSWNYIRLYANLRQYVHESPLGKNLYEFVPGIPRMSSHHIPAFQMCGSMLLGSMIASLWYNGEKVLPLPIEGRVREDPLVREAVVFGVDQSMSGLLVFRATEADHMSDNTFLDVIWSSVADANSRAEVFFQITRDMIRLIPSNTEYPQTNKSSIIRTRLYDQFAHLIKKMYAQSDDVKEEGLNMDLSAIEEWIMTAFRDIVVISFATAGCDFFSVGLDSQKAIQMSRLIQRNLDIKGRNLSPNIVYEKGNARELAKYFVALSKGHDVRQGDELGLVRLLIDRYSVFQRHEYRNGFIYNAVSRSRRHAVLLTGATGSVGAHTLAQLLVRDDVERVYCLVRGSNPSQRIFESLSERRLEVLDAYKAKIYALAADLSREGLGIDPGSLALMRIEVSLIIHIAWPVNFNIRLQSFESHIRGLHNLLRFSLSIHRPEPAQVFFCSSISVALNTPPPASVAEAPVEDLDYASPTGYARSKMVGEHIVRNAASVGARAYTLRIGQVVGDTKHGMWNDKDFIPMMIRSALTLNTLPILQERCSWLPVDTVATTILELSDTLVKSSGLHSANSSDPFNVYNVVNPHIFPWEDILAELRARGLHFAAVPFGEWLRMLQEDSAQGESGVTRNPAVKLVEYFEKIYGGEKDGSGEGVIFETTAAQKDSKALRAVPRVIEEGYMGKFVDVWLQRWSRKD